MNYERAVDCTTTRHSQVRGYTDRSRMAINTRPSERACFTVILTTSENSNMGLSLMERPLRPQRPPNDGRWLAGYEGGVCLASLPRTLGRRSVG